MEITTKIVTQAVLLFAVLFCSWGIKAQEVEKIDPAIFPDPVLVAPDPPKAIKGWKMGELEGSDVLIGEYPGKILKFQFEGDAVGIVVAGTTEAGIIEYSVDNYPWQKKDLFMEGMDEKQQVYFTLETGLKPQKHMLQLRLSEESNPKSTGQKCLLQYFYFNAKR